MSIDSGLVLDIIPSESIYRYNQITAALLQEALSHDHGDCARFLLHLCARTPQSLEHNILRYDHRSKTYYIWSGSLWVPYHRSQLGLHQYDPKLHVFDTAVKQTQGAYILLCQEQETSRDIMFRVEALVIIKKMERFIGHLKSHNFRSKTWTEFTRLITVS